MMLAEVSRDLTGLGSSHAAWADREAWRAVLKKLDEALPGCGAPLPVIKGLGIDHALNCRPRANTLRLPVHLERMKAGVKRTKVILK